MDSRKGIEIIRVGASTELADVTAGLIAALPSWFGIPEANDSYVASATYLPGLVARRGTEPIAVLLHRRHFAESAEIHMMAVDPNWQRRGVGRALINTLARPLAEDGCRLLQVKTLGETHPDPGYAQTRAFYRSVGFIPVEETNDLWPGNPCLIMVKWLEP